MRAVLGQQVSTAAARTLAGRLVITHGRPIDDPDGGLTHLFPTAKALTGLDPQSLAMPATRRATLLSLVAALAEGRVVLDPDGDLATARSQLATVPGIGPWTVEIVAMRGLGDRDAFIPTDLGIRSAATALGLPATPGGLTGRSRPWRPWRAHAVQYLWAVGEHAVNIMPS